MPKETKLQDFEKQKEVITDLLNDMVDNKLISEQAIFSVALNTVCSGLATMPRNDYKEQMNRIKNKVKYLQALKTHKGLS